MKLLATFLMAVLMVMAVFAAPPVDKNETPKPRKCVPGKTYIDGCNYCWCETVPSEHRKCTVRTCYEKGTNIPKKVLEAPEDFWMKDE